MPAKSLLEYEPVRWRSIGRIRDAGSSRGGRSSGKLDLVVQHRIHRLAVAHGTRSHRVLLPVVLALIVAGCASMATVPPDGNVTPARPTAPPIAPTVEPPPPAVNLSGFPLPYRQGYADGCASATGAERKDATRFTADGNYRTGWQDGLALCRKK